MVQRKFFDRTGTVSEPTGSSGSNGDAKNGSHEEVKVHHVPFKIEYEGPANVHLKFNSKSRPLATDSDVLINQFRGRSLQGQKMDLPKNYEGLIVTDLTKSCQDEDDGDGGRGEAEVSVVKRFDSVTYWNWDRVPSGMDKHQKLMDWIELSDVLHEPIEDED